MSDPDPREWIVVHLLDVENLTFSRDPFALGLFEIALRPEPFEGIEAALRESAHHWSILFGFDRFRIRQTLYGPPTAEAALREGWLKAKEALSVFALATHADVRIEVREAGCAVDIATGEIVLGRPLAPTQQGTMIVNDTVALHPFATLAQLLSAPEPVDELGRAVRRSAHWTALAKRADDAGERLILSWIAGETIAKVSENDDIVPRLLTSMGIVSSVYMTQIAASDRLTLSSDSRFQAGRKTLQRVFTAFRSHRNKVAHQGFRELELGGTMDLSQRRLRDIAIPHAVRSVQGLAVDAIALGVTTIASLWSRVIPLRQHFHSGSPLEEAHVTLEILGL